MPPLPSLSPEATRILAKYTGKSSVAPTSGYVAGGGAAALAALKAPKTTDKLASQKKRLETSAYAIINSDAPFSSKLEALKKLDTGQRKGGEGLLTRALNILNKPLAITTAGVARVADPNRNFLADVRNNITPTEIFATQKWFQDLPTAGKIAVGIGSSIALDPLTYIAPSAKLAALGDAAGLSKSLKSAARAAEVAGNFEDAARARTIAGNLLRKGQGGIGALDNATIKWAGNFIGVDDLKAGIYFNVPGTGRIANRISKTLGGEGIKPVQIYLGRPMAARKISSIAYNTLGRAKTSSLVRSIGDHPLWAGGEGTIKRKALEAASPEEALFWDNVIDGKRLADGSAAKLYAEREAKFNTILQRIETSGVDPADIYKAQGGNVAAKARVDALDPELMTLVDDFEYSALADSMRVGQETLSKAKVNPESMNPMYDEVELHQSSLLTQEAIDANFGKDVTLRPPTGKKVGPEQHRRVVPGYEFFGQVMQHPTEETVRYVVRTGPKENDFIVVSAGFSDGTKTADEIARERGAISIIDLGDEGGQRVRYRIQSKDGGFVYDDVPLEQLERQVIPANAEGLSVREQANQLVRDAYGYDLFDFDYRRAGGRALENNAALHRNEVLAAYLIENQVGVDDLDVILKDYPKGPQAAAKRIEQAADNLLSAMAGVYGAGRSTEQIIAVRVEQVKEMGRVLQDRVKTLTDQMKKAGKKTPKVVELRGAIAAEKAKQVKLMQRLERLEDKIVAGKSSADEIMAEIDQIAGGLDPATAAAMDPEGAVRRLAASTKTSENVAPIPDVPAAGIADLSDAKETERALLSSQVRDAQFDLDETVRALQMKMGATEKDVKQAQKTLDSARKKLDDFNAKNPAAVPTPAPAAVAEGVPTPAPAAVAGEAAAVAEEAPQPVAEVAKKVAKGKKKLSTSENLFYTGTKKFEDFSEEAQQIFNSIPDPKLRSSAIDGARLHYVPSDRVDEFVSRFNTQEEAFKNLSDVEAKFQSGKATGEQLDEAQRILTKATADLNDLKHESLSSYLAAEAAVNKARRLTLNERLGFTDVWKAEPPSGGYSPEWERATIQNVVDNSVPAAEAKSQVAKRVGKLKAEMTRTAKGAQKKNVRPIEEIRSDVRAYETAKEFIDSVDTTGARAAEAAMAESAAFDKLQLRLQEYETRNATVPAGLRPDPNLNPSILSAKRDYEMAQKATVEAVNIAEDNAKAASFLSSTDGLNESQVKRIVDSTGSGNLDDVIKQVASELSLPVSSKKVVAKAAAEIGDDPDAMRVVTKNANDAALVERTTKAAKGKKKAVEAMGGAPGEALTGSKVTKAVEEARGKIAELRDNLAKAMQKNGRLTKDQQKLGRELDAAQGRIDAYTKELDRIQRQRIIGIQNRANARYAELDEQQRVLHDALEASNAALGFALQAERDALKIADKAFNDLKFQKWKDSAEAAEAVRYIVREGYKSVSRFAQAPADVADALALVTRVTAPGELPAFFKYFDKFTNIFKSWAVATPGFIARNGYSAAFMMYLDNIPAGSVRNFVKADFHYNRGYADAIAKGLDEVAADVAGLEEVTKVMGDQIAARFDQINKVGVLEQGGQADSLVGQVMRSNNPKTVLDRLASNPITDATYKVNSRMERAVRGGHMMGVLENGGTIETAIDKMFKFHFNYSDINKFESRWMRRVAPFYVWLRKNLPLQLEMIFRNPKAYNRYTIFKDSIEAASDGEDIVPSWIADRMSIRLPWTLPGGQMYVLPDLPIKDLNILTNYNELIGSVNPVIKTPIEMLMDTKLYFGKSQQFQGYVQMPDVYQTAGLGAAMEALGFAKRDKDGKLLVQDKQLYALEQFLPFFGRARRLLPSEEKYQDRLPVQVVNTLFGLSLRANTKSDKAGELYKRQAELDKLAEELSDLGWGGYEYWRKQVTLASKPTDADKKPYLALLQPKGGLSYNSPYTNVSKSGTDWQAAGQGLAAFVANQQKNSTGR